MLLLQVLKLRGGLQAGPGPSASLTSTLAFAEAITIPTIIEPANQDPRTPTYRGSTASPLRVDIDGFARLRVAPRALARSVKLQHDER